MLGWYARSASSCDEPVHCPVILWAQGTREEAMRTTRLSKGAFLPDEVTFLGRVLEVSAGADETAEQRERRAARIIANYIAGITDERELAELSRRPLGR